MADDIYQPSSCRELLNDEEKRKKDYPFGAVIFVGLAVAIRMLVDLTDGLTDRWVVENILTAVIVFAVGCGVFNAFSLIIASIIKLLFRKKPFSQLFIWVLSNLSILAGVLFLAYAVAEFAVQNVE